MPVNTAQSTQPAQQIVGKRYQLVKQLGQGGMGAVYQAQDRLTGQSVALKRVLVPTQELTFASKSRDMDTQLALAQEFRLMASLRHPNINSVLDYGFDERFQPYFTMELLVNAKTFSRSGALKPEQEKVQMIVQLLQALAYLHRRDIIHRDLKPGNILVVDEQVKVLDFGLSITRDHAKDMIDVVAGTLGYIAPELLLGDPASASSDLYAVGIIGYELLTGIQLYADKNTDQILKDTIEVVPEIKNIRNPELVRVLSGLLAKDPRDRYQTADEVIAALSRAAHEPRPPESAAIRDSYLQAARFVGRDSEMDQLVDALVEAANSHGGTSLVGGESGVGKTRLLDELRTQALVQGVLVMRGQNTSEGKISYEMWLPVLRWLCLLTDLTKEEASIIKTIVPDIEILLGREIPDAPKMAGAYAQQRVLSIIEKMFRSQQQPILIILEDLHWADEVSLNVLNRINQVIHQLPVLIVGSYRSDERPTLPTELPGMPILKLSRLSDDGITELTVAMLGENGRQKQLLDFLKRETEGNVFFLVEIVRALAEMAGQLGNVGEMALPQQVVAGGVKRIVEHRLERVLALYSDLLHIAAVAGRQIDLKILRQLYDPTQLDKNLIDCANMAVLEVQDGNWRFAHDKLRDGVLAHVSPDERKILHGKVATAIETVYLYAPEYIALTAYHWTQAGDKAKESHYAALAGKQSLASGAYQQAINFLNQSLALSGIDTDTGAEKKRATIKEQIGDAYMGLGQYDNAKRFYEQSLEIFQIVNYRWGMAAANNHLGNVALQLKDDQQARQHFDLALKAAMDIRAPAIALTSAIGIAQLLFAENQHDKSLELVMLVRNNPACDWDAMNKAEQVLSKLKESMSAEVIAVADERGKNAKLSEVSKRYYL